MLAEAHADIRAWEDDERPHQSVRTRLQLVDLPPTVVAPPWQDKLQMVPAMRSALIPLDADESEAWSKPFSLVKADFEPWSSYYAGYRSSRLFLQAEAGQNGVAMLDYPVRALLELKRVDARFIIEPPVQIDAPVEYFDATRAPGTERNAGLDMSLTRAAEAMHRSQLRRAHERGREMGNDLYTALLGNGLSNLIAAWERSLHRKPTPHELHLMLTTGRAVPVGMSVPEPRSPVVSGPAMRAPVRAKVPPAIVGESMRREDAPSVNVPETERHVTRESRISPSSSTEHSRSNLWYLLHLAGAVGAAGLFYLYTL